MTIKKWSEDEIKILKRIFNDSTYDEMAITFNCANHHVRRKMQSLNLTKTHKIRDVTFLLSDNLESFYWMGFLLADGSFIRERNHTKPTKLSLLLSEKDEEHLDKLANILGGNKRKRVIPNSFSQIPVVEFTVSDVTLIPKICEKFDIKPNKTYNPPNFYNYKFTDDQLLSLLIGFIDGDGSITKSQNNKFKMTIFCHISWCLNMEFMNTSIHKFCRTIKENKIIKRRAPQAGFVMGKTNILKKLKYFIIKNKLPVLERKWESIEEFNIDEIKTTKSRRMTKGIKTKKSITIENITFESISEARRYFSCSKDLIKTYLRKQQNELEQ